MDHPRSNTLTAAVLCAFLSLALPGCSGARVGVSSEPDYREVEIRTDPPLARSVLEPWVRLITVDQAVQVEAWHLGKSVNDKVVWIVQPWKWATDPTGIITKDGRYRAPTLPSFVSIEIDRWQSRDGNIVYQGGFLAEVLAAAAIDAFTADPASLLAGQSTHLTAIFRDGTGQVLTDGQVAVASVASGVPVTVTPSATTTYTLRITNPAGAAVDRDLVVTVQ